MSGSVGNAFRNYTIGGRLGLFGKTRKKEHSEKDAESRKASLLAAQAAAEDLDLKRSNQRAWIQRTAAAADPFAATPQTPEKKSLLGGY